MGLTSQKKPKCWLDKRRNCIYPDSQHKICSSNTMICEEMKPIRGEWHHLIKTAQWENEHKGYANQDNIIGGKTQ